MATHSKRSLGQLYALRPEMCEVVVADAEPALRIAKSGASRVDGFIHTLEHARDTRL
jgi:hypothetical protein